MGGVSANNRAKNILPERNHPFEAFMFYRTNKTIRVGVHIRTLARSLGFDIDGDN